MLAVSLRRDSAGRFERRSTGRIGPRYVVNWAGHGDVEGRRPGRSERLGDRVFGGSEPHPSSINQGPGKRSPWPSGRVPQRPRVPPGEGERFHSASTRASLNVRVTSGATAIPLYERVCGDDGRCWARTSDLLPVREEQPQFVAGCAHGPSSVGFGGGRRRPVAVCCGFATSKVLPPALTVGHAKPDLYGNLTSQQAYSILRRLGQGY